MMSKWNPSCRCDEEGMVDGDNGDGIAYYRPCDVCHYCAICGDPLDSTFGKRMDNGDMPVMPNDFVQDPAEPKHIAHIECVAREEAEAEAVRRSDEASYLISRAR